MKLLKNILTGLSLFMATASVHLSAQEHKPYVGSKAFEQLKDLVGHGKG